MHASVRPPIAVSLPDSEDAWIGKLGCWTPLAGTWSNARIIAVEVSGTIKVNSRRSRSRRAAA